MHSLCKSRSRQDIVFEVKTTLPHIKSVNLYNKTDLCKMVDRNCDSIKVSLKNKQNSCYLDSLLVALLHDETSKFLDMLKNAEIIHTDGLLHELTTDILNEFDTLSNSIINADITIVVCSHLRQLFKRFDNLYSKTVGRIEKVNWTSAQLEPVDVLRFIQRVVKIPNNVEYRTQSFGTNSKAKIVPKEFLVPVSDNTFKTTFVHPQVDADALSGVDFLEIKNIFPRARIDTKFGDPWRPDASSAFKRRIEKITFTSADMFFIHINRIFEGEKLNTTVDVPLKLKLKNNKHNLYLRSIIVHHGNAVGGHYTAFIQCKGLWYHFDDMATSIVKIGSFLDLVSYKKGYVFSNATDLFYS